MLHVCNPHNEIRQLCSRSIVLICQVELGRAIVMERRYVEVIIKLFDDHVRGIRYNAYESMLNLSEYQRGVDHMLEMGVLGPLVDKLIEENEDDILVEVLRLMERSLSGE